MNESEEMPPLRMAPIESPAQLAERIQREQRNSNMRREDDLSHSLSPYRVGSVKYLNAVPLTRGVEREVLYKTPSELAEMLRRDELDAALVSLTEVLFHDRYDILDGIAVASLGEVKSVILAHRGPLEEARTVHCDPASLTSVNLLRVLLAEKGLQPEFKKLESYAPETMPDGVLLIGDPAIDFIRSNPEHHVWDLGQAWFELTNLPFVYAVWALRRGIDLGPLKQQLRNAKAFGLETLEHIIRDRSDYDLEFRKDYLGWHIHYHMGQDERAGIERFMELLRKHKIGPVFPPRFVV
jgi:chorismate dehydratase